MSHPSRLALDRLSLGAGDEETKAHAAGCAQCQAHLQKVQVELPVPVWVRSVNSDGLGRDAPPPLRGTSPLGGEGMRWLFAFGAVAAVVLAVVLWPRNEAITPKAAHPEAVVWLKHDGKVSTWSGQAVHPNDSFELELAPAGFTQLTIAELTPEGPKVVLRQAVNGHGMSPAFSFDDAPGPERMAAVLSNAPLTDDEVGAALEGHGAVWTQTWTFPKEIAK